MCNSFFKALIKTETDILTCKTDKQDKRNMKKRRLFSKR